MGHQAYFTIQPSQVGAFNSPHLATVYERGLQVKQAVDRALAALRELSHKTGASGKVAVSGHPIGKSHDMEQPLADAPSRLEGVLEFDSSTGLPCRFEGHETAGPFRQSLSYRDTPTSVFYHASSPGYACEVAVHKATGMMIVAMPHP